MKLIEIKDISGAKISLQDIYKWGPEKIASMLEVDVEEVKKINKEDLKTIISLIGKHDFVPDDKFDAKELAMGIKVEKEHSSNPIIAKLVAKDHLMELPDYYSRLKKMENE